MKKILVVVLVIAIALVGASAAMATIAGSKHDLSATASGGTGTYYTNGVLSSCQYCHTPHHANGNTAPLWNRTMTTAGYTLYGAGITLSGTTVIQPGANSQTCLSCHDGVVAVGAVLNGTVSVLTRATVLDGAGKILTTAAGYIGTNLGDDHPVGVVYRSVGAPLAGLTNNVNATTGKVNGQEWKIYGGGDGVGRVECGSCHDPHTTVAANFPFLKDTLISICSDCHANK
jgi:predicted CXXCH cytochrome family protein